MEQVETNAGVLASRIVGRNEASTDISEHPVDVLAAQADRLIAAYATAAPRYIRGRADAAALLAKDNRLTAEQKAYWRRIADGCNAALANVGGAA